MLKYQYYQKPSVDSAQSLSRLQLSLLKEVEKNIPKIYMQPQNTPNEEWRNPKKKNEAGVIRRVCVHAKLLQLCPTLCNPIEYSLPGSFVHGILQAWILEWVSMPSSRGSSRSRDRTCVSYISCTESGSLPPVSLGKPLNNFTVNLFLLELSMYQIMFN